MATDISRLVNSKHVHSFDSFGFITSSANDYGFDSIFKRWIENCVPKEKKSLLVGLSCSGTSKNIINAFEYGKSLDCLEIKLHIGHLYHQSNIYQLFFYNIINCK